MEKPTFKYQVYIATPECGVCPPGHYNVVTSDIVGIRYAYGSTPHYKEFLPIMLETPTRHLSPAHKKCGGYALSFFKTVDQARASLNYLCKTSPALRKKWNHCLSTTISVNDGLISPTSDTGHFELHEYQNVQLELKSVYLEKL